jgi:branched-chain amino acid aminotransferase
MHLNPMVSTEKWLELVRDGIKRFDKEVALYIRPMYWAEHSGALLIAPDPQSTKWCLSVYEAPMRKPEGFSITLSPYRKPSLECMPVNAKAGCLYPNNARALIESQARGFGNCVVLDLLGNVAELATANIFIGKDGVVFTPAPNDTFLNGITRHPDRRRDFFFRQLLESDAGEPHRGSIAAAWTALSQGTRAVLGICACLSARRAHRSALSVWG